MVLFVNTKSIIYAKNDNMTQAEMQGKADAVWYDGDEVVGSGVISMPSCESRFNVSLRSPVMR